MECSWNDRSKTQYYVVILDRLQGHSGGLEQAPELHVRGLLTTIAHLGLLPVTKELAMHFAERACSGILDLYVGYDERVLDTWSRDLTTF